MSIFSFSKKCLSLFDYRDRITIGVILLLMLLGAGLEMVSIGLVPVFLALLSRPELIQEQANLHWLYVNFGNSSIREFMILLGFCLVAIYLFKNTYIAVLTYWQNHFLAVKEAALALKLLSIYLHSPYIFHLQRNSANLIQNISEVSRAFGGVFTPIIILATESSVMFFIVILLSIAEPVSSFSAVLVLGGLMLIFSKVLQNKIRQNGKMRHYAEERKLQWISQGLGGIKETKILGRESFFVREYEKYSRTTSQGSLFLALSNQLPNLFVETVVMVGILVIVIIALWQGRAIHLVLQTVSLFAIASLRLLPSIKRILSATTTIRYYKFSVEAIYADLVSLHPSKIEQKTKLASKIEFEREILLQDICYHYPNAQKNSLESVSLSIKKGDSIGFIGASGAGKTTLIDLILGLLTPTQGQILVDGKDIQTDLSSWQRYIGYIPQTIYLSDDTIRRNIAFGLPDDQIFDRQVWEALAAAQLDRLVHDFPDQLDTIIGEGGMRLSGGQRQRIGIARAIYHNPEILVMDEATAALDNATEREFLHALESMSHTKTLITIAHRLSTVKNCDRLFLLQHGKIIDSGTYDQLIANNPDFATVATHDAANIASVSLDAHPSA